ncbi:MAG TPA: nicotinate-nicotinamide nucleotide adenylyltransferase [Gaiellaceae bacterium]|nr:nicotinate-nicotinamide nucleotide adenylyltransferase [Gaiellaceae bacterium]
MAVGVFGGRFDPPHLGHLALARAAVEHFRLDALHVTVVADAAHKESSASAEHRLGMAQLTFAGLDAAVELERHRYTVDALEAKLYEDPIFLIGGDELAAFPTWKEPERVLELARLGVAARSGWEPPSKSDRIEIFELAPQPVSSTEIRELVRRGEPIGGLVAPAVAEYIAEHNLYRDVC